MDVSRLRKRDIKAWVPVDDEVKVLCSHIDQEEWEDLKNQATTVEIANQQTGETEKTLDPILFRNLVGRRVVLGTEGLTDGKDDQGNDLPFETTPANVDMLMARWTEFRLTVMGSPLLLGKMLSLEKEQLVKNS
jgi:hypothetical protein